MTELTRGDLLRRAGAGGAALTLLGAAPALAHESASVDSITWALASTIRSLDFPHSFDVTTAIVLSLGLEGLLTYDASGALKPNLARSWTHPDALTYVYKLRPGV